MNINNIKDLVKIANELDRRGMTNEADDVDSVINNITESEWAGHPQLSEFIKEWKEDGRFETLDAYMKNEQRVLDSLNEGSVGPELPFTDPRRRPGILQPSRIPGADPQ